LIVCCIGYGYLAKFVLKNLIDHGALGIGISSKVPELNYETNNLLIYKRNKIGDAITYATHLIITAPPKKLGCPVYCNFKNKIIKSNIKSITYISSTGVYGNHNGNWVNEDSELKAKSTTDINRIKAERQWLKFCKKFNFIYNIIRLSGIYGPERENGFHKKYEIVDKKGHCFSRIHVLDAARIISEIIVSSATSNIWNLADDLPSTRKDYLLEIAKLKQIEHYKVVDYKIYLKNISKRSKKFWENNKKVSNQKLKRILNYEFIAPNYKRGLRSLKDYL